MRMSAVSIAKEFNEAKLLLVSVNAYHVTDAIKYYKEGIKQFGTPITVMQDDTVQIDRLTVELARRENEILALNEKIADMSKLYEAYRTAIVDVAKVVTAVNSKHPLSVNKK